MSLPTDIGVRDLVDVAIVAVLLWAGVAWLRRSRARLALLGLAIVGVVYLAARSAGLQLTAWLLQGFFAVFVIVVVVVFQEDLRRLFEQIAVIGLRRRSTAPPPDVVDTLVRAAVRLASTRTGALLVLPGREPLDRHLEGGIPLDGRISEPLLYSVFDPHSPGHDGAVLVAGERAALFAVHLPLSSDRSQLGQCGTRHAAALGLAERTDALCVVVSEERGTISVARDGRLRALRMPQQLGAELRTFLQRTAAKEPPRSSWRRILARGPDALIAASLAGGLWFVLIPGSGVTEVERTVPVVVENLPEGYVLESVEPDQVVVTMEGRRRDLYLGNGNDIQVRIDGLLIQLGRRTFQVTPAQVHHPPAIRILGTEPSRVRVSVRRTEEVASGEPG